MNTWDPTIDGWILATALLCAGSCALLGNYLVLRRLSLMGDAISHAVLPGIAVAFLVTGSRSPVAMFAGATAAGVLTTLLTETVRRYGRVEHSAAMGVIFSVLFAIGLILIRTVGDHVDLDPGCVLYGNINYVGLQALSEFPDVTRNLIIVAALDCAFVCFFYKELKICAFDPQLASSLGMRASLMHYALMVMVALTTVASFEAVGSILVIAMLIVPAAAASLLTDRLGRMILISIGLSLAAAAAGQVLSTTGFGWLGLSPDTGIETSALIVVILGCIMAGVLLVSPEHGLMGRGWNRAALHLTILREDMLALLFRWSELSPDTGMDRDQVLDAMGRNVFSRVALLGLRRQGLVRSATTSGLELSAVGLRRARDLVRSHRLWETYLAHHFDLPLDHLHAPAERVEHYITPQIRRALDQDLPDVEVDPHGKDIPEP